MWTHCHSFIYANTRIVESCMHVQYILIRDMWVFTFTYRFEVWLHLDTTAAQYQINLIWNKMLKTPRRILISSYNADCMLLITPLLRWYVQHGLLITKVHLVIEWEGRHCFRDWMEEAANTRGIAQRDPSKAIIGESAKLLANSAYGKMCEDRTRFRRIRYCNRDKARVAINPHCFVQSVPCHRPQPLPQWPAHPSRTLTLHSWTTRPLTLSASTKTKWTPYSK